MKTTTKISEINQEDLVNLLTTATYRSEWLSIGTPCGASDGLLTEDDCREDAWAKVILAGKKLFFYDYYAEDENDFNGNLPHKWDKYNECIRYEFTLEDIANGIAKCIDNGGWELQCVYNLINNPQNLDLDEAEAIMQVIVFGEVIYG